MRWRDRTSQVAMVLARGVWQRLPARMRKDLEDRFFYAVFQATRVENDAYGWTPPPPPEPPRDS